MNEYIHYTSSVYPRSLYLNNTYMIQVSTNGLWDGPEPGKIWRPASAGV